MGRRVLGIAVVVGRGKRRVEKTGMGGWWGMGCRVYISHRKIRFHGELRLECEESLSLLCGARFTFACPSCAKERTPR